ncbi:hypothetical protein IMZ48_05865, partial [Candidatus Bathyarchaeota archaeon]|nr:hypothetical protein [Candidatus Bathyarchaeota archaeon]
MGCESSSKPTETSETPREETNGGNGEISRGAVAGIAVGVTLFAVLLCAGAFIWYRKRHLKPSPPMAEDALNGEKAELEAIGKLPRPSPTAELDSTQPGVVAASELAGEADERHELAGARTQA